MGFFSQLFGADSDKPVVATIQGTGQYACPVVGESHYQDALESICGGRAERGADKAVTARLIYEPENPYDELAVRVDVQGRTVGYLDRQTARSFRNQLRLAAPNATIAQAAAVIRGVWDDGQTRGSVGIGLDGPV